MHNQDLIFRPWKTSFKYIQNQEGKKPSLSGGASWFFFSETRSSVAVVGPTWTGGKLLQIP